jgi:hypothetical protein
MRIRDWRMAILFLLAVMLAESCFAGCPLLVHDDPNNQREFQNVCQQLTATPLITTSAAAPTFTPRRVGDIDISTSTAKVYIATATISSASWAVVN